MLQCFQRGSEHQLKTCPLMRLICLARREMFLCTPWRIAETPFTTWIYILLPPTEKFIGNHTSLDQWLNSTTRDLMSHPKRDTGFKSPTSSTADSSSQSQPSAKCYFLMGDQELQTTKFNTCWSPCTCLGLSSTIFQHLEWNNNG